MLKACVAAVAAVVMFSGQARSEGLQFNGYAGAVIDSEDAAARAACRFELGNPLLPPANPVTQNIIGHWESFMWALSLANDKAKATKEPVRDVADATQILDGSTWMWHMAMLARQKALEAISAKVGLSSDAVVKVFDDAARRCVRHLVQRGDFVIDRKFEPVAKGFGQQR